MDCEGNAGSIKNGCPPHHSLMGQEGRFSKTPETALTTKAEDPSSREHRLLPKSEPRKTWEKPGDQLESEHLTGYLISSISMMTL